MRTVRAGTFWHPAAIQKAEEAVTTTTWASCLAGGWTKCHRRSILSLSYLWNTKLFLSKRVKGVIFLQFWKRNGFQNALALKSKYVWATWIFYGQQGGRVLIWFLSIRCDSDVIQVYKETIHTYFFVHSNPSITLDKTKWQFHDLIPVE